MHGDELGAVGEGSLDLHVVDHLGDALHHLSAREDMATARHQLGDAAPVACALDDMLGDECDSLGMIELHAALQPGARRP